MLDHITPSRRLISDSRAAEAELAKELEMKKQALAELEERKAMIADLEEKEAKWKEEALRRQEEVRVSLKAPIMVTDTFLNIGTRPLFLK